MELQLPISLSFIPPEPQINLQFILAHLNHSHLLTKAPSVILGSFSNYLVTKSSVPVMVARKRLRKHSKYKRPSVRLANNLTAGVSTLAKARVDELWI
jgi:hypothetical protein